MFIDYTKIHLIAGNGGSGCVSFHREKFIAKGGPDGGDGGRGGSIILKVNPHLRTLKDFTYRRVYKAKRGQHGMGSNCHGRKGQNIVLEVPLGTVVKNAETGEVLVDFTELNQRFTVAKGGRGGKGNARFTTPTHQSPREWEVGFPGDDIWIELELKLIADIGLVGLPNAGKSTLLSRISAAKPKIADYPFTTLAPNLGIVPYRGFSSFVVADIPGLIEGAHTGKGLGIRFLRHIERTRALVYLIDINEEDPEQAFKALENELREYNPALIKKPAAIILTKLDTWQSGEDLPQIHSDLPVLTISSVRGDNLDPLKDRLFELIKQAEALEEPE